MSLEPISIVVPTYDAAPYLKSLHDSITNSPLVNVCKEVIYICEGHGDNTDEVLKELGKTSPIPIRAIRPPHRLGKFHSRFEGAKLAQYKRVLLIDSRVKLTPKTARAVAEMPSDYKIVTGHVDIDEKKNIFCLYWLRTHARIFHRNFEQQNQIIKITPVNFDDFVTGTTILFTDRDLFVSSCAALATAPMFSDDTFLLKEMSAKSPLIIHPDVRIEWEPRREWWKFLKHLYDRGPGFAEYHVFERRGWLFYLVMMGFLGLLAVFGLLFVLPEMALGLLALGVVGLFFSTLFFSQSIKEFFVLAPLHTLSLIAYGLGAVNGVRVVFFSRQTGKRSG